jgi:hypothetical protein
MDPRVVEVLRRAHFEAHPAPFAIVGLPASEGATVVPLGPWSAAIQTGEELTFYVPESDWDRVAARFPKARVTRGWRLITVQARIPWNLHGVLGALTASLAAASIPCAALCSFNTDHLLVPADRLDDAMRVLRRLREAWNA